MQLRVVYGNPPSTLAQQWAGALDGMVVRHPDPTVPVKMELRDGARLELEISIDAKCTIDRAKAMPDLKISTVRLTYFPGVMLARAWLAAAWGSYCLHEGLELVTIGDTVTRPLDPHKAPHFADFFHRQGTPHALTPESLRKALCGVLDPTDVEWMLTEADHGA